MAVLTILFGFAILMNGSSFAAMHGRWAQELGLPGSTIIPYVPWVSLGGYIAIVLVIMTMKTAWKRWVFFGCATIVANGVIGYPIVLLERESVRIPVADFLSRESQTAFEAAYPIKWVSYSASGEGTCVRVRRSDYSFPLAEFVTKLAKNQAEGARQTTSAPDS